MKKQSIPANARDRLTTALFIIYLIVLYWVLLLKLGVRFSYVKKRSVNLVAFSEPVILTAENILNVMIFIPLGLYAGILFRRWIFGNKLLFSLLLSLLVEGLQYIFQLGAFDVTDIVTNTLGGLIGLLLFKGIDKAFNNSIKAQNFINIIAATGTVLIILFFVLLKMNLLPIRFQ